MGNTLRNPLLDVPRKALAMKGESLYRRGETNFKKVAEPELARALGRVIERAIELSGLTREYLRSEMDLEDTTVISKWISGAANPQMAKLLAVPEFKSAFVEALAERGGAQGITVRTVIEVERRRA